MLTIAKYRRQLDKYLLSLLLLTQLALYVWVVLVRGKGVTTVAPDGEEVYYLLDHLWKLSDFKNKKCCRYYQDKRMHKDWREGECSIHLTIFYCLELLASYI